MVDITQDNTVQHFHWTFPIPEDNLDYLQQSNYTTSSVGDALLYVFPHNITNEDMTPTAPTILKQRGHSRKSDAFLKMLKAFPSKRV